VQLKSNLGSVQNYWTIYVVPKTNSVCPIRFHSSITADLRKELFGVTATQGGGNTVMVAAHFDDALASYLERGGRVLLLPDGETNSFPLNDHWFLRGAPYLPRHALSAKIPRELLLDMQHFDLSSRVISDLTYLDDIDPLLLLWDTHDLKTVKTHGLIFETRVGKGRLLVSAVRHRGQTNAAGRWLLQVLLDHLSQGPMPRHTLTGERWAYLKNKLRADQINLTAVPWRFKPDPKNEGLAQGWQLPQLASNEGWNNIRIGAAWEGQGYPTLDGWAWYRLQVEIPPRWRGRDIFLSFEGVDDIYELYVNGILAGKGGDLATRKDAFNEHKSHNLSQWVKAGQTAILAVRVYDWYGAGGIFRPVTLGTLGFAPGMDMLK